MTHGARHAGEEEALEGQPPQLPHAFDSDGATAADVKLLKMFAAVSHPPEPRVVYACTRARLSQSCCHERHDSLEHCTMETAEEAAAERTPRRRQARCCPAQHVALPRRNMRL
jgi:hypothetical protein